MNPALRVLKNSTALSATVLLERALGFLLPWYIARAQGNEMWGVYNTALPFVTIAVPFAYWGLDQLVPREIARQNEEPGAYLGSALLIGGSAALLVSAATLLITRLLNYPTQLESLIFIAVLSNVFPRAEAMMAASVITGLERMEIIAAVRLPLTVLRTLGAVWLLIQGYGLVSLFLVLGAFHLAVSLLYIVLLYRFIPGFRLSYDRRLLRSLAISAIPFVVIIFTGETVRQVDRIFISKLWDTDAVGYYATGTMLIQVMYLVAPAMMTALFPGLSRVYVSSLDRFGALAAQLFKLLLVATFPLTLGIIGLAGWIIPLVFGSEYEPSVAVLRITALGIVPSFVARFLYRVMLASDNERLAIHTAVFKGMVSLALNAALIPSYGILGASVAAALTELLGLGQNLLYVSTKIVPFDYRNALLRPGVSILASSAVYLFLSGASHIVAWLAASVVFVVGILLTGAVRLGELQRLLGLRVA